MNIEIRTMREEDREAVRAIHRRSFNVPREMSERMPPRPLDESRVAEEDGVILGAIRVNKWAHFFGGRSIPGTGISGVTVAPEARGRQVAEQLMVSALREFRERGFPISTLYPATVPLYRRCGFEYLGVRTRFRTPLRLLPRAGAALECEPWDDGDLDEVAECYRTFAVATNGLIDRPPWVWTDRLLVSWEDKEIYRTLVREDGRVTGYMVYTQEKADSIDFGYNLDCRDFVWTTPEASRALLAFAGRHRSVGFDLEWTGPPNDALCHLISEQDTSFESWFRPMLRLADVPAALEARGYPPRLECAVELAVTDPTIDANAGGWRVEVSDGTAKVAPAPGAPVRVDAGTLAALFSGMLSSSDARRLGRLDASEADASTLDAMFAGPPAWILDWF